MRTRRVEQHAAAVFGMFPFAQQTHAYTSARIELALAFIFLCS